MAQIWAPPKWSDKFSNLVKRIEDRALGPKKERWYKDKRNAIKRVFSNRVIIIDEAHNLPDWARGAASESLSLESINRAVSEVRDYGYLLPNNQDPVQFLNFVEASIEKLAEEHILDEEAEGHLPSHIVSPDSEVATFETEMMSLGKMTLFKLKQN